MRLSEAYRVRVFPILIFFSPLLFAQQNPPPTQPVPANHLITLDVVVGDHSGQLITDLQQQSFTLFDNKQPQTIVSFRATQRGVANPPEEVVIVLDEVNTSYETVAIGRHQLESFLKQDGGNLARPTSLVFFSDKGTAIGNTPTADGNSLVAEMNDNQHALRSSRRSQGVYGALERLDLSLNALQEIVRYESKRPGRKLLIWLSPGWALLSGPNIRLTPKQETAIFDSAISISDMLRQARITVYDVNPLGMNASLMQDNYYKGFVNPVKQPNQVHFANVSLQVIATQSGGLVLNSDNDIAKEIGRCFADAGGSYEIGFNSQTADGPNDYHALQIKIDKPGLTARTRIGYYAQP